MLSVVLMKDAGLDWKGGSVVVADMGTVDGVVLQLFSRSFMVVLAKPSLLFVSLEVVSLDGY